MIFQVIQDDLDHEESFVTEKDLNKWVIVIEGVVYGRFETREDAVSVYREVWFNHHS